MMDPKVKLMIDALLSGSDEESDANVKYMMMCFAKRSVENARSLVQFTNLLVDAALAQQDAETSRQRQAVFMLVAQTKMDQADKPTFFASMLPVCKVLFPNGNSDGGNEAEKAYFEQFKRLLADKRAFSWERDRAWADTYGYTEYLKLVERQMKEEKRCLTQRT